jgi:hypothetical protein
MELHTNILSLPVRAHAVVFDVVLRVDDGMTRHMTYGTSWLVQFHLLTWSSNGETDTSFKNLSRSEYIQCFSSQKCIQQVVPIVNPPDYVLDDLC